MTNREKAFHSSLIKLLCVVSIFASLLACSMNKEYLPNEIMDFNLIKKLKGKEAKSYLDRLHQKEVTPAKNEVGFYVSRNASAEIYITYYAERKSALDDYTAMSSKICSDSSVFYNCQEIVHKDKTFFKCYGLGKEHFIFVHQKELFWLSVGEDNSMKFLDKYLEYID